VFYSRFLCVFLRTFIVTNPAWNAELFVLSKTYILFYDQVALRVLMTLVQSACYFLSSVDRCVKQCELVRLHSTTFFIFEISLRPVGASELFFSRAPKVPYFQQWELKLYMDKWECRNWPPGMTDRLSGVHALLPPVIPKRVRLYERREHFPI
jgi:hypothetical protein